MSSIISRVVSGPVVCVGVWWVTSTGVMTSSGKEVNATGTGDRRVERSRGTEHLLLLAVFKNKVSAVVGWVWQVMAQRSSCSNGSGKSWINVFFGCGGYSDGGGRSSSRSGSGSGGSISRGGGSSGGGSFGGGKSISRRGGSSSSRGGGGSISRGTILIRGVRGVRRISGSSTSSSTGGSRFGKSDRAGTIGLGISSSWGTEHLGFNSMDIYEEGATTIDITMAQTLGRLFGLGNRLRSFGCWGLWWVGASADSGRVDSSRGAPHSCRDSIVQKKVSPIISLVSTAETQTFSGNNFNIRDNRLLASAVVVVVIASSKAFQSRVVKMVASGIVWMETTS